MDSANTSTSSFLISKYSMQVPPSKREIFLSTYRPNQAWSLPKPIIEYMAKNPLSPTVYEKLIKSCKYFFIKNPLLVASSLEFETHEDSCKALFDDEVVDFENVKTNIWATNVFVVVNRYEEATEQYFSSTIIPKIYKNDIKYFRVYKQNMSFDDLILLVSKCEEIKLQKLTVKDENGDVVTLERIIEALPDVKKFEYCFEKTDPNVVTSKTVKEMVKIPHFLNLTKLELYCVPESINLDDFYSYIKNNNKTLINFQIFLMTTISNEYKNRLQKFVDKIIDDKKHDFMVPFISFPGRDDSSHEKLQKLHRRV